jgi:hypothetical protein
LRPGARRPLGDVQAAEVAELEPDGKGVLALRAVALVIAEDKLKAVRKVDGAIGALMISAMCSRSCSQTSRVKAGTGKPFQTQSTSGL